MDSTKIKMSDYVWYDECFRIYENRFKMWISVLKDGQELVTAADKELCISMTRFYLKGRQEGWGENSRVINSGVVGGKL